MNVTWLLTRQNTQYKKTCLLGASTKKLTQTSYSVAAAKDRTELALFTRAASLGTREDGQLRGYHAEFADAVSKPRNTEQVGPVVAANAVMALERP